MREKVLSPVRGGKEKKKKSYEAAISRGRRPRQLGVLGFNWRRARGSI